MFDIRKLIDKDGVLRIPEVIHIASMENCEGICCRPESIGNNSFDGVKELKELYIPAFIKEIKWSFYECTNLERIVVDKDNPYFKDIDGVLYSKDGKELIAYPNAHCKTYQVPAGVVKIAHSAFKSCSGIEIVRLPKSLTEIGINAFYQCNNLQAVFLPDDFQKFSKPSDNADVNCIFIHKNQHFTLEGVLKRFPAE
ncbi:MAG: leucine-rich repeat protein [Bacteroidaceae bacterium]|nr:leucine-rich repeat protein [Bacteroidaceae bacterium]